MALAKFILVGVLFCLLSEVLAHSFLTNPISRNNQRETQTGCRGPQCLGPCETTAALARTAAVRIERGASVNLQWPRNNHAGGFIRIAWAPTSHSASHSAFDSGVQQVVCHERGGCFPDDPSNPNGGDSGPSDGSSRACSVSINVPLSLTDGNWTMQWAWFGGAFALGDYYSCVDYTVSGGISGVAVAPVFIGGDYTYPNENKCKFFNTDRLHRCVSEPCDNPVYSLNQERSGQAFGISNSSAPIQVPVVIPVQVTSGRAAPVQVTSGRAVPATTAGRLSITTGRMNNQPQVATTGSARAPVVPPVVLPPNSGNCAGALTVSSSTATMASVETWGDTFRMVVQINAVEARLTNWRLQIVWPTGATSTRIRAVYNAAIVTCEAISPNNHVVLSPVAPWANNLQSGGVATIEILASNTNMNSDFIRANTRLSVFVA